jgi:hypothetical protein
MRISKSLAVKVGTVVATAAIAVGGVATVASASTPDAAAHVAKVRTETILTGHARPVHVNKRHPYGTAHIVGQLTTPGTPAGEVTGVRIWLLRRGAHGKWHVVRVHRTGRFGRVAFQVYHVAKGATFELVFRGNINFARSKSPVIVISTVS